MKKRLALKACAGILLTLFLFAFAINCIVIVKTERRIKEEPDTVYDCILVLGAGVKPDGTPSHMLEDRLLRAIALYESGASDILLMSGDRRDDNYDEVGCMKSYAVSAGVPEEAILTDECGLSTYESVYRAKTVYGFTHIAIVTQEYHLPRALYIAGALSLKADGYSASLRSYGPQPYYDAREALARIKDFFKVLH